VLGEDEKLENLTPLTYSLSKLGISTTEAAGDSAENRSE